MSFVRTGDLIATLQARLAALALEPGNPGNADRLFQRVGAFGANRLSQAMKATFAAEQRVCFIVPGGDKHATTRDRLALRSVRTTALALLIADRAFDSNRDDALVGGPQNLGILELKDRVIDDLFDSPFTAGDLAFAPGDGEPLIIEGQDKAAGNLGRECYLLWLHAYAGERRVSIP